jgi:hypothetical protein
MVNELGPAVVLIHTLPNEDNGDEIESDGVAPLGVTSAQVVPTLISSNSIKGVLVALSCLTNILSIP